MKTGKVEKQPNQGNQYAQQAVPDCFSAALQISRCCRRYVYRDILKKLTMLLFAFAIAACQPIDKSVILEINHDGYYIDGNQVKDLKLYISNLKDTESTVLIILVADSSEPNLLITAINYAKTEKFKKVSLSTVVGK